MSVFTIYPYEGYDNLKFNMSQAEVQEVAGIPPKIIIDNILQEVYEYRNGNVKLTYVEERLVDVWIPEKPLENRVVINGQEWMDLMQESTIMIMKSNYDYKESKNRKCAIFPELGICTWGCGGKKVKEGKAIVVFSKERLGWYEGFLESC